MEGDHSTLKPTCSPFLTHGRPCPTMRCWGCPWAVHKASSCPTNTILSFFSPLGMKTLRCKLLTLPGPCVGWGAAPVAPRGGRGQREGGGDEGECRPRRVLVPGHGCERWGFCNACSCGVPHHLPTLLSLEVLLVPVSQAGWFGEAVSCFLWGWVIGVG